MNLIQEYIVKRGLWQPKSALKAGKANDILASDEKLALVAGLFNTYGNALAWVLEEKVKEMAAYLITEAEPGETIVVRQNMLEVADIFDECEKYAKEYEKRNSEKDKQGTPASSEATSNLEDNEDVPPPVVTGEL